MGRTDKSMQYDMMIDIDGGQSTEIITPDGSATDSATKGATESATKSAMLGSDKILNNSNIAAAESAMGCATKSATNQEIFTATDSATKGATESAMLCSDKRLNNSNIAAT